MNTATNEDEARVESIGPAHNASDLKKTLSRQVFIGKL